MKKVILVKNHATLLLILAIFVLCIGFLIAGCGTSPQLKAAEKNKGAYALDFTDCPASPCLVAFSNSAGVVETIEGKEITLEAWINPKAVATATAVARFEDSGAALTVTDSSSSGTPDVVKPGFKISRVVLSASGVGSPPTSTATYTATGNNISINTGWYHIAGVLTKSDHSAAAGHPTCAGVGGNVDATDDPWHLDLYQDGTLIACSHTYGENTAVGDLDQTLPAAAYAGEPVNNGAGTNYTSGILDEARIWNVNRSAFLSECMNRELGLTGNCSRLNNLVLYSRFNEGEHFTVTDYSGVMGNGAKEYDPGTGFTHWETGWTTNTPGLSTAD